MQVNDLVRVVIQPDNQCAHLTGEVGVIVDLDENFADLRTFNEIGQPRGLGTVPLSCLKVITESEPGWQQAKRWWTMMYGY